MPSPISDGLYPPATTCAFARSNEGLRILLVLNPDVAAVKSAGAAKLVLRT